MGVEEIKNTMKKYRQQAFKDGKTEMLKEIWQYWTTHSTEEFLQWLTDLVEQRGEK